MLPTRPQQTEWTSEEFFRLTAESIPQFVWTTRPDGGHEYFNQRWLNYTGLSLDEALGDGWQTILHPDDSKRCLDHWHDALNTLSGYEIEFRLRRFDGAFRWHLGRAVPIKDEAGNVFQLFGTCTVAVSVEERQPWGALAAGRLRSLVPELETFDAQN